MPILLLPDDSSQPLVKFSSCTLTPPPLYFRVLSTFLYCQSEDDVLGLASQPACSGRTLYVEIDPLPARKRCQSIFITPSSCPFPIYCQNRLSWQGMQGSDQGPYLTPTAAATAIDSFSLVLVWVESALSFSSEETCRGWKCARIEVQRMNMHTRVW